MLQVPAHAANQSATSDDPCIISNSGKRTFTRKVRHCKCGATRTAAQSVVSGHHYITVSSPMRSKKVSHKKDSTVNAAPPEPLCNRKSKAIYTSSPIRAKNVSLDKVYDREFTSARIMIRSTSGLGYFPGKNKIFQQIFFLRLQPQLKSWR